jgi:hypothetical protein
MTKLKDIFNQGFDKVGKPRIVKTSEELRIGINNYFNSILKTKITDEGEEQEFFCRPTISGLALFLGYASRQSIYHNKTINDEYCYLLKKATTFIEKYHEEELNSKNVTGHIFALKNMGWTDKSEVETKEVKADDIDLTKFSDAEMDQYEKLLEKGTQSE